MKNLEACRTVLSEIGDLLEVHRDSFAPIIRTVVTGPDEALARFSVSGTLWTGQGSIVDSALVSNDFRRKKLEDLLLKLGKLQIEAGKIGLDTKLWVRHGKRGANNDRVRTDKRSVPSTPLTAT
jgi:hypothetical protein